MRYYKKKPKYAPDTKAFTSISVLTSKKTKEHLEDLAYTRKVSVSTLVARAIYNEIDCKTPFENACIVPKMNGVNPDLTASRVLYQYVVDHPGLNVEHLVLSRLDLAIDSKELILQCYAYLVEIGALIEYRPNLTSKRNKDYLVVKAARADDTPKKISRYAPEGDVPL